MKDGVILLNTSRGTFSMNSLPRRLQSGKSPPPASMCHRRRIAKDLIQHPLIQFRRQHDNLIITPHVGGVTYESQEMAFSAAAQKLVDFLCHQNP